ncbi:unnamed protein product [Caenorhabditis sp. 36 PRJEB53466]|nr:unnamed protein product [Caenorhabditis sp. 36 PRJEB53466]
MENVRIDLLNSNEFKEVHPHLETRITDTPKLMIPRIETKVVGLRPDVKYTAVLEFKRASKFIHDFIDEKKSREMETDNRILTHPDGVKSGEQWCAGAVVWPVEFVVQKRCDSEMIVVLTRNSRYIPVVSFRDAVTGVTVAEKVLEIASFYTTTTYRTGNRGHFKMRWCFNTREHAQKNGQKKKKSFMIADILGVQKKRPLKRTAREIDAPEVPDPKKSKSILRGGFWKVPPSTSLSAKHRSVLGIMTELEARQKISPTGFITDFCSLATTHGLQISSENAPKLDIFCYFSGMVYAKRTLNVRRKNEIIQPLLNDLCANQCIPTKDGWIQCILVHGCLIHNVPVTPYLLTNFEDLQSAAGVRFPEK